MKLDKMWTDKIPTDKVADGHRRNSSMTTINSVNRPRHSADSARLAGSAERLSLLTESIVVIDDTSLDREKCIHEEQQQLLQT